MITNEDYLDQAVCVPDPNTWLSARWGRIVNWFEEREWHDDLGWGTETYFEVRLTKTGRSVTISRREAEEQLQLEAR